MLDRYYPPLLPRVYGVGDGFSSEGQAESGWSQFGESAGNLFLNLGQQFLPGVLSRALDQPLPLAPGAAARPVPPVASAQPSWLMPALLAGGALVLFMVMKK